MDTPQRPRFAERAARLVEGALRYLVARPAQLLIVSLLLVCLGAGLAAVFWSGRGGSVLPATPTAVSAAPQPHEPASASATSTPTPPPATSRSIRLRPGDTLWALARRYGTTVAALRRLNSLGSSTLIRAGHWLLLPASPPGPR